MRETSQMKVTALKSQLEGQICDRSGALDQVHARSNLNATWSKENWLAPNLLWREILENNR